MLLLGPTPLLAAEDGQASASEVLSLPRYCWGQFNPNLTGPQFKINDCGVGMNHYCGSVLEFNRSYSTREEFRRVQHLTVALRGVEYTLGWMKDYPNCPIREDVLKTYTRVRSAFVGVDRPIPPDRYSNQWASPLKPYSTDEPSTKNGDRLPEETKTSAEKDVDSTPVTEDNALTGSTDSSKDTQTIEAPKIGSPTNPYCRFCPD
jgi:hypothetical protein